MNHATSILLAGANDPYLEGLRFQLQASGYTALTLAGYQDIAALSGPNQQNPSLVVVNLQVFCNKGWELLQAYCRHPLNLPIIAFNLFREPGALSRVLQTGARGCLDKSCAPFEIGDAVQTVLKGHHYYSNRCRILLARHLAKTETFFSPPLYSEQEKAVIRLVCAEYSNKQIASQLHLSVNSIERVLMRIRGKMGVKSTNGLVLYAARHGLCNQVA